jgi:hypothetical protein
MSFPSFKSFPNSIPLLKSENDSKLSSKRTNQKTLLKVKKSKKKEEKVKLEELDYFVDLKGDKSNLKYQSLRNQPIPIYKRWSHLILGENRWKIGTKMMLLPIKQELQRINYSKFDTKERIIMKGRNVNSRGKDFTIIDSRNITRNKDDNGNITVDDNGNITVDDNGNITVNDNGNITVNDNGMDEDFIKFPDKEIDLVESQDSNEFEFEFQDKNIQANRLVQSNPHNVQNWIDFINLQDSLSLYSKENQQRIIDKKHSILEKALDFNPDSDVLLTIYMDLHEYLLDDVEYTRKWNQILANHPSSFVLWKSFIDYRMCNVATYSLNSIIELYQESLESISNLTLGKSLLIKMKHGMNYYCICSTEHAYFSSKLDTWKGQLLRIKH